MQHHLPHHHNNNNAAGGTSTSSAPPQTPAAVPTVLGGHFVDPKENLPVLAATALPQVATLLVLSSCCVGFVQGLIASVDVSYRAYGWEAGFWLAAGVTCLLTPIAWARGLTIRLGVLLSMIPLALFIWIEQHFGSLDRCTQTVFLGKALAAVSGGVGLGGFTSFTYASLLVGTSAKCLPAGAAAVASASTIIETLVALAVEVTRSDAPLLITEYTGGNDIHCIQQAAVDSNSPFKVRGVVYGSMGVLLLSTLVCSLVLAPHHSIRRSDGDSIDTVRYKSCSVGATLRRLVCAVGMAPTVPLLYLVGSSLMTAGLCLTLIAMYRVNLSVRFFRYYNTLSGLSMGCSALIQIPSSLLLYGGKRGCTQQAELRPSARTPSTNRRYTLSAHEIRTTAAAAVAVATSHPPHSTNQIPLTAVAETSPPCDSLQDSAGTAAVTEATAAAESMFPLKHYRRQLRLLVLTSSLLLSVEIATGLSGMFHNAEVVKLAYVVLAVTMGIPVGLATPLSNWYVGALCGRHLQTTVILLTCHAIPFLFRAYQSMAISLSQSRHTLHTLTAATCTAGITAAMSILTLAIRAWRRQSDTELLPDANGMTFYARLHYRDRPAAYFATNLVVLQQEEEVVRKCNESVCTSPPGGAAGVSPRDGPRHSTDELRRLTQQLLQQQQLLQNLASNQGNRQDARGGSCCASLQRLRSRLYLASDWVTNNGYEDDDDDDDNANRELIMHDSAAPRGVSSSTVAVDQLTVASPLVSSPVPASGRSTRDSGAAAVCEEIYLQLPAYSGR